MPRKKVPTKKEQREEIIGSLTIFTAVAVLPIPAENYQKVWFNDCITDFGVHLAKRGSTEDNGITYTRKKFVGPFCDALHPELTEEERQQYWLLIGHVRYLIIIPCLC